MADLPANVGTGIVRISLRRTVLNKSTDPATMEVLPVTGKVTFTPSTTKLINASQGLIIPTTSSSVHLDGNGDAVVTLMATDDTDQNPVDWTYTVSFSLDHGEIEPFSISVAEGSDVELSDVIPVPDSNGTFYLTGEQGPPGPGVTTSTGSPEGVVTGDVGEFYADTAATNGASVWYKTSGSGNTGWKVLYGDTGWRNIASYFNGALSNNFTSLHIRRVGNTVFVVFIGTIGSTGTVTSTPLPTGFARLYRDDRLQGPGNGQWELYALTTGHLKLAAANTNNSSVLFIHFEYTTVEQWPTTLPGSAA